MFLLIGALHVGPAFAEPVSIFANGAMDAGRVSMLASAKPLAQMESDALIVAGPSLFADRALGGLFAPVLSQPRVEGVRSRRSVPADLQAVRDLIGRAESASAGYDAIHHGAKRLPMKRPSQMTIREIFAWIEATPGQPHAIGYYQFIPDTLERLVSQSGVGDEAVFTPALQDALADVLLQEAGLYEARAGRMERQTLMHNLAKIWAGLPTRSGLSYYHGYAGNRATMSWAEFDAAMARVFPS
ncbi:lysozyme family protein [Celeribacter litoreus]|uniref:hypothetical protein n=1 Tax=Celeribacter litoreus TaxID=2876714 RepID=UPI001CCBFF2F|nr:hypothetical protein [Celeribacter litoreus]